MKRNAILLIVLFFWVATPFCLLARQETVVKGRVLASGSNAPLPGALVRIERSTIGGVADIDGGFELKVAKGEYTLTVSYLGYMPVSMEIAPPLDAPLEIMLKEDSLSMDAVEIVSTGYQELPRERATGSFVQLDRELLNRKVSTNLLDRMEDVTSGMVFNRLRDDESPVTIRGRSTLFANTSPLVIVDGFPYDGALESINPNDVESITVLKDAAAASIWGARAGNGVIVITLKDGEISEKPIISLTANLILSEKQDPFYVPRMGVGEFVDFERKLFREGIYESRENSFSRDLLSPVVETLIAHRDGLVDDRELEMAIDQFKSRDFRRDIERYYYRQRLDQQYALSMRGGNTGHRYIYSLGYDQSLQGTIGNKNDRFTLNAKNSWTLLGDRFKVETGIYVSRAGNHSDTAVPSGFAYDRLADENGRPLAIGKLYSTRYMNSLEGTGLLDWTYVPLKEIGMSDNLSVENDMRVNGRASYKVVPGLTAEVAYQYWLGENSTRNHYRQELFSERTLINSFTQEDDDGTLVRPVPMGGRLELSELKGQSHTVRAQVRYNGKWNGGHQVSALAGSEVKDLQSETNSNILYGYKDDIGQSVPVDHVTLYRNYVNPYAYQAIPSGEGQEGLVDRFVSYYANAAYNFRETYSISLSARKDQSNIFGVDSNMRGVPLWSAGVGWLLSNEGFYASDWMPYLRFRATYGYSGNVDKSLSAYTTARYAMDNSLIPNLGIAYISNPPNPNLRWEKVGITNVAVDFESRDSRLRGTLEYYRKLGEDLISSAPFPASSGRTWVTGNFANTATSGIDLSLDWTVVKGRDFAWNTNLLYSFVSDEVTDYKVETSVANFLGSSTGTTYPKEGNPIVTVYSYKWGGLDPANGQPIGFVDGEPSTDYGEIINTTEADDLVLHGRAHPAHFGALRNTLDFGGWSISFNISYRMGYFYRRRSVGYNSLLTGNIVHGDYAARWRRPGDEQTTQVPAVPSAVNSHRDNFYQFSSQLVERGDHIRLQDVRVGYTVGADSSPLLPFRRAEIFAYANNLGIIWKAAKDDPLDPDFQTSKPLRSIAFGLRIDL
ncbi:SusC/RagA family TonB-linked outer membrane protein [Echinicola rosea]|uniref:SusC/RagA family TonB-linked outer membrane protein n=1 Tax=Echinicola rosea TaxID=1807691 RepID=A0ABQ1UQ86_9BACT|nr:SusC/RagA family TonB-linked outer membrane protein [Echinicola rosea]GGF24139.1 SusC/RagA family TonB-linked outer membrane protein [Echinicola rosea]